MNLPYNLAYNNMTESNLFRSMLIGVTGGQDSSAAVQPKAVNKEEWVKGIKKFSVPRSALNAVVMEYLVKEGFKDAAMAFKQEVGLSTDIDMQLLDEQTKVRKAVEAGDIQTAMELVNDFDPDILDTNPRLYFHLQQQQLLELIRKGQTEDALVFAQNELSARGEEHPEYLEELEQVMGLLAFDDPNQGPFAEMLHNSQRMKVASELNDAILASQNKRSMDRMSTLMKMIHWAQKELKDNNISCPVMEDISSSTLT